MGSNLRVLIRTDHQPLKTFITSGSKSPKGKRARWLAFIQKFDAEITYIPGNSISLADVLSRPNFVHLIQTNKEGIFDLKSMQSNDVFYSNIKSTIKKYIEGGGP